MKIPTFLLALALPVMASPIPDFPFLYVKGQASENVPTSQATIRFHVSKRWVNSEEAEKALGEASQAVRKGLLDLGVKNEEINAADVSKSLDVTELPKQAVKDDPGTLPPLGPVDEPPKPKGKEPIYTVTQEFTVTTKNLKIYPALAKYLMASSHVTGYRVDFAAGNRDEVNGRLRKAAFANAKKSAKDIAKAGGGTLGRMYSASEEPYGNLGDLIGEGPNYSYGAAYGEPAVIYEVPAAIPIVLELHVLYRLDEGVPAPAGGGKPAR